jgi:hypothetical protein
MKEKDPTPKFCPICGKDSIQHVSNQQALQLFRCGQGHYFVFDIPDRMSTQDKR